METLILLALQLISGAIGGNIAGVVFNKISLGPVGNTLAGIVGGLLCSQAIGSSLLIQGLLGNIINGGAGGGALMLAIGLIKKLVNKESI